jgi:outer membrane immunogenic protein
VSATGRLGYAADHWLLYAKGGPAWAHDKYSASQYNGALNYTASETRSGWTLGGGLEWAFANDWSAKLEYAYYDFGSRTVGFVGSGNNGELIDQRIHAVKVGINYHFWPGASQFGKGPVVTRY